MSTLKLETSRQALKSLCYREVRPGIWLKAFEVWSSHTFVTPSHFEIVDFATLLGV